MADTVVKASVGAANEDERAHKSFNTSILVSGCRCVLTYVVLPFITPLIGLAPQVGPLIGIPLGTVALVANIYSIRRFWRADHKWKKPVTVMHLAVICLLIALLFFDIRTLL